MVTLHEVITFLVSMQISISSLQTHNVNRCGRSRHLARKLSLRRKRSSPNVFERSEERFSRNAETDLVCRLLLEKKKTCEQTERSARSQTVAASRGIGGYIGSGRVAQNRAARSRQYATEPTSE